MTDINIGAITEALNDKSDRDLRNVDTTAKADAVIDYQEPTAGNDYTWYRKYKSGWVEQGGLDTIPSRTGSGGQTKAVTFPVKMSDSNYTAQISFQSGGAYFANCQLTTSTKTQTGMSCDYYFNESGTTGNFLVAWEVKGFKE